jgi:hypothetical protein
VIRITFGSDTVITIWVAYFVVAAVASGVFLIAGRRSRHVYTAGRLAHELPEDPLWDEPEADLSESPLQADAGAALRLALKRLGPVMANRSIQAEVAAAFGLRVRMGGEALADLLEEMLGAAIHAAPASRVLLTAVTQGERVAISITDDMPNGDADVRRACVRGLMERVALRGGSLDVDVRPQEGTTMTLRLAAAREEGEGQGSGGGAAAVGPAVYPGSMGGTPVIPSISFGMSH